MGVKNIATRWPASNFSIHCACTAVWSTGTGDGGSPVRQRWQGKEFDNEMLEGDPRTLKWHRLGIRLGMNKL